MPDKITVPDTDTITVTNEEFLERRDLIGLYANILIVDEEGEVRAQCSTPRDALVFDWCTANYLIDMGLLRIEDEGDYWVVYGATTIRVWKESQDDDLETILNRGYETVCCAPKEFPLDWDQKRHLSRWIHLVKTVTGENPELSFSVKKALDQVQITVMDKKSGHEIDLTRRNPG